MKSTNKKIDQRTQSNEFEEDQPTIKEDLTQVSRATDRRSTSRNNSEFLALVEDVKRSIKRGELNKTVFNKAIKLDEIVSDNEARLRVEDELIFLKSKNMIAEIFDYMGCITDVAWLKKKGEEIYNQLPAKIDPSVVLMERELIRERIRFCLNYAQIFYWKHEYGSAKDIVKKCHNLCNELLKLNFFCYGTLAEVNYHLGRFFRQTNEYNLAEKHFADSIKYYYLRIEERKKLYGNDLSGRERIREEINFVNHRVAISLALGLGWVNYTRGYLERALINNILPAKVLLSQSEEDINKAYVDLVCGSIERSLAGSDKQRLGFTIKTILQSYLTFQRLGHVRYMARAAYELSLLYLYSGNLNNADSQLKEVETTSTKLGDHRWICNAKIVRSRIRREQKNYLEAEAVASEALDLSMKHKHKFCQIDALIARSEARIELKDYKGACKDLNDALESNKNFCSRSDTITNPKIETICHLLLARSYALERNGKQANEHFAKAEALKQTVEHASVHERANKVKAEIEKLKGDFVIQSSPETLSYRVHLNNLQKFLFTQAREKTGNLQEMAKLIGISRQTIYEWDEKFVDRNRQKKK